MVDTIRSAGKISREEIDRKWASARINDNHESRLADSTFFRYKNDVEELFDIEILCDRANGLYYIDDSDINSQTKQWLLSQFAVSQSLDTSRELRDRILYEPIPEGTEYLTTIATPPFWGIHRHVRMSSICGGGVDVNEKQQCLTPEGEVIEGLYALGNCAGKFYGGIDYPLDIPGLNLGHNYTQGYMVGRDLAAM